MNGAVAAVGERCKGCGRCSKSCPMGAIRMDADDVAGMAEFLRKRIEERTDIFAEPTNPF